MKRFEWDEEKNVKLRRERNIGFEEVLLALEEGNLLDVARHSNTRRYGHQKMFIIKIGEYAYMVPFVEDEEKIFLKTIIPSRKATKSYLFK